MKFSFSEFIDSALARFVEKLIPEQNGLEEARNQLSQRFSDPNNTNDESNRYFIYTIKQKNLEIQEQLLKDAPSALLIQEDFTYETPLHIIARDFVDDDIYKLVSKVACGFVKTWKFLFSYI